MRFWKWLAGHWAYAFACLAILFIAGLVFAGRMTPDVAAGGFTLVVSLLLVDLRPLLQQHHAEMVQLLTEVAAAGRAAQTHNVGAAIQVGELAVQDGAKLAEEVQQEKPTS